MDPNTMILITRTSKTGPHFLETPIYGVLNMVWAKYSLLEALDTLRTCPGERFVSAALSI